MEAQIKFYWLLRFTPRELLGTTIICLFVNLDLGQYEYKTMRTLLGIEPTAISHTHTHGA